ncbi:hypothetical protein BpHYR1_021336 [Brachionus plicatilis]|uniref:Uncharacterized protein n=1 Tax=Brachionus plicatilis TaxID=10195 RepID=A0A3M7QAN5_BRAPC|nr:hypothetical protein BpHYR1_021336 [Brachionus plicatilis]
MRPQKNSRRRMLRVSQHLDVRISALLGQQILDPVAEQADGKGDLFEQHHIHLDSFAGLFQQNLVQSVLQVLVRPLQKQLRTKPPVCNEYFLFGIVQSVHHMLHVLGRVNVPLAQLVLSNRSIGAVGQEGIIAEASSGRVQTMCDLISLQIAYFYGVVGARFYFCFAAKGPIDHHGKADQVIQLGVCVDNVSVFENEPAFGEAKFKLFTAEFYLTEVAVVDVVATDAAHKRERRDAQQLEGASVIPEWRICEHFVQVVGQVLAAFVDHLRADQIVVLVGKQRPLGLVVLFADVRARSAQVLLDQFGQGSMTLFYVLVGADHLPFEWAVCKSQCVVVRVEYVSAVFSLGCYAHSCGHLGQKYSLLVQIYSKSVMSKTYTHQDCQKLTPACYFRSLIKNSEWDELRNFSQFYTILKNLNTPHRLLLNFAMTFLNTRIQ